MAGNECFFNIDRIYNWHGNFYEVEKPLLKAATIPVVGALPAAALIIVELVHLVVGAIIWAACKEHYNDQAKRYFNFSAKVFGLACTFSLATAVIQALYMFMKKGEDPFWVFDNSAWEP